MKGCVHRCLKASMNHQIHESQKYNLLYTRRLCECFYINAERQNFWTMNAVESCHGDRDDSDLSAITGSSSNDARDVQAARDLQGKPAFWKRLRTGFLPFLIFRHPETSPDWGLYLMPFVIIARVVRSRGIVESVATTSSTYRLIAFTMLLVGALMGGFFMVYICFSFNGHHYFPSVGSEIQIVLLIRNIILVFAIQFLCFCVCEPNSQRLHLLLFDMRKFDPNLAYMGVFHSIRKFRSKLFGQQFRMRWFSTFLSDSILLGGAFLFYIAYYIMRMAAIGTVDYIFSALTDLYRGVLTCGLIIYTLEFAPKIKYKATFNILILLLIAMQWAEFFLFIGDKKDKSGPQRAVGAIGQLYLTHSSVLLGAILGGHHFHGHLSPDLKWSAFWRIIAVVSCALVWLSYSLLREVFAYDLHGEYNHNWVPISYPWVFWGLCVVGGIACIYLALRYSSQASYRLQHLELVGLDGDHAKVERMGKSSPLEFDVLLIVITFVMATVYYSSESYAYQSVGEYLSFAYSLTVPIAPIGLAMLAVCMWWDPPSVPKFSLYFGLFMGLSLLASLEVIEDCHLNSSNPTCCEYPWLPDVNHHKEEPHKRPECVGLSLENGECLALVDTNSDVPSLSLIFTAVFETTRSVVIETFVNQTLVSTTTVDDLDEILKTESCLTQEMTSTVSRPGSLTPVTITYPPGCYGEYVYDVPASIVEECVLGSSVQNFLCTFNVKTLNCAFVPSEELVIAAVDPRSFTPDTWELLNVDSSNSQPSSELAESSFYVFFRLVGMAALLECFFTLSGVILKLVFLSECRTLTASRHILSRRATVVFNGAIATVITEDSNDELVADGIREQSFPGDLNSKPSMETM